MAYGMLLMSALFWSGNFVISRGMHADIPAFSLSFWRWGIALLIILPFAIRHVPANASKVRKHFRFLFIQGILGVTGFNSLIYFAMQSTTVINAVLINSCIPVLIPLFALGLYKERLSLKQFIGILLSMFGVFYLIVEGKFGTFHTLTLNQGDILVFCAAVVWSLYSTNLKRYPEGLHPLVYLLMINIIGQVFIAPLYVIDLLNQRYFEINWATVSTIAYVAIFTSVIAFIFWNRAVREVGANKAGPFVHLMPVFSTILAMIFLNEIPKWYHLIGISLIFTGITLSTIQFRRTVLRQ